jgi:hypothetical protein
MPTLVVGMPPAEPLRIFNRLTIIQGFIMSQSLENSENVERRPAIETLVASPPPKPQEDQRPQIQIDDSQIIANYANFCRVTGTPEELIIDFGLNTMPIDKSNHPIKVTQRIVMDFFTAKRTMHALQLTVERHEDAFGVLETDVQRRVQMRPAQS